MIAKSEYSEVISNVVLLFEKQVSGMTRVEIVDFLEVLNTSVDKNLPVIIFGKKGQLLFKDVATNTTRFVRFPEKPKETVRVVAVPMIKDSDVCYGCIFYKICRKYPGNSPFAWHCYSTIFKKAEEQ